ncbi:Abortive infection bacteriophage resistance protein [Arthrobacter sp. ZXY-2]|nr:Abortive infection bacteriophage resistance protein [Arthrobacter sp. ZXY-2]
MTTPDSTYAKPFLTIPEQLRRLRGRGMDCGIDNAWASGVLERHGYYRLSGYWHLYRARPTPPAAQVDDDGRDIRLDSFVAETSLRHVVSLYEFDHDLRTRLGDALSTIETAFRFFIGHRLGRVNAFGHRDPELLGAVREQEPPRPLIRAWNALLGRTATCSNAPTKAYCEWLEEYDRHEARARGEFVQHFRDKYGPHLPIWVATEVMSFGVLSNLYNLMRQADQEILAARFQVSTASGRGDRGALANWLNSLRSVRNICAHYGRLWNRTFDVVIDAPGQARKDADSSLAALAAEGANNKLYGVLLIMRHLLLSIAPDRADVVDIADFIEVRSAQIGFSMSQLGFPEGWRENPIWGRGFALDPSPMLAASLLDRADSRPAVETRAGLTGADATGTGQSGTPEHAEREKKRARHKLLKDYLRYRVVIEIELGGTKFYPAFQFRDGKIIDALAEINRKHALACGESDPARIAAALLDWWQTPHPGLPPAGDGYERSPLELLDSVSELEFNSAVSEANAMSSFAVP